MPWKGAKKGKQKQAKMAASPLGGKINAPSDPRSFTKAPWYFCVVKIALEAGGGTVPISTVRKALAQQLLLDCVEPSNFVLSFLKAFVYTNSFDNSANSGVGLPELTVGFSTLLTQTAGTDPGVAGRRQISDVGTQATPAKVGYKWGILGRVAVSGVSADTVLEVNTTLESDVYVHLMWNSGFYVNTFAKEAVPKK